MATDPNDDDDKRDAKPAADEDDDESDLVPIKRQPKSLIARKSLPTVESALDDFIIAANQKIMDVAEFTPETREKSLRDEIEELKKKLTAAESKAANAQAAASATEAPAPASGRSWGAIAGAFVIGAGLMFAVGKLTASEPQEPVASGESGDAPPTAAPSQPAPQPATDPIAHEPAVPPTTPVPPTTQTAQTPTEPATTPKQPTVAAKQAPKAKQPPKTTTTKTTVPAAGKTGDAPKPPPPQDGSGSDLYNPF